MDDIVAIEHLMFLRREKNISSYVKSFRSFLWKKLDSHYKSEEGAEAPKQPEKPKVDNSTRVPQGKKPIEMKPSQAQQVQKPAKESSSEQQTPKQSQPKQPQQGQTNHFFRSLAQTVNENKLKHPLFNRLANDPKEFSTFLATAPQVLRSMGNEGMDALARGDNEAMQELLQNMVQEYLSMSPELRASDYGGGYEEGRPGDKLRHLAAQAASVGVGIAPQRLVEIVDKMVRNNPKRVADWEANINTVEDFIAKLRSWHQRGLID